MPRVLKGLGFATMCVATVAIAALPTDPAPDTLTFPQKRGAVYEEIHAHQALGGAAVAPDGSFVIYEWSRPYDWAPDYKGLSKAVAARKQTFLYKVATSTASGVGSHGSEYLFYPAAGATYYLGTLSPDARYLSFYELDWDDKRIRAAVVLTSDGVSPKITWFEAVPDAARLDQPPVWLSNEEVAYPVKSGPARFVRVNIASGEAKPCSECDPTTLAERSKPSPAPTDSVPADGKWIGESPNGALKVFAVDTPEVLKLIYKKDGGEVVLFENDKRPRSSTAKATQ